MPTSVVSGWRSMRVRADVLAIVPGARKYLRRVSRLCAVQMYLLAAALQYIVEGEHAVYPPLEPVAHCLFRLANYIICLPVIWRGKLPLVWRYVLVGVHPSRAFFFC